MFRLISALLTAGLLAAACVPASTTSSGTRGDGQVYRIGIGDTSRIQFRMLDSVNALRSAAGQPQVELNSSLNAAAATHAKDMAVQNRPWHFGSDGSSPYDRVQRVGYAGSLVGETISESYETELETLAAWMDQPDTRRVIMSPEARQLGFSWHQEASGKIWWVMVMGG